MACVSQYMLMYCYSSNRMQQIMLAILNLINSINNYYLMWSLDCASIEISNITVSLTILGGRSQTAALYWRQFSCARERVFTGRVLALTHIRRHHTSYQVVHGIQPPKHHSFFWNLLMHAFPLWYLCLQVDSATLWTLCSRIIYPAKLRHYHGPGMLRNWIVCEYALLLAWFFEMARFKLD